MKHIKTTIKPHRFFDKRLNIYDDKSCLICKFTVIIYTLKKMINRAEKLSLLSEMIAFVKYDSDIKNIEYKFLLGVAKQLEISRLDFDYLIEHPVTYTQLKTHSQRIVQFHRLVLLMNIESKNNTYSKEVVKLYNFGLKMGISHESISKVLYLMDSFPNKIVPPDVLIDIFKIQYN